MSWKRKDWLQLAGMIGLGATGAGLAGVGPLAGLLGAAETGAGAAAGAASLTPEVSAAMGTTIPGSAIPLGTGSGLLTPAAGVADAAAPSFMNASLMSPAVQGAEAVTPLSAGVNPALQFAEKAGDGLSKAAKINAAINSLTPQQQPMPVSRPMMGGQQTSYSGLPNGYATIPSEEELRRRRLLGG